MFLEEKRSYCFCDLVFSKNIIVDILWLKYYPICGFAKDAQEKIAWKTSKSTEDEEEKIIKFTL